MNIIWIGPPACGKGTQAKKIKERFNLNYLSTGDMFRDIIKQDNELSREIKSLIDKGKMVPDDLTLKLVDKYLTESTNYLLDGFPRTLYQAEQLEKRLKIDYIIEISVPREVISKRIIDRGVCKNCGKTLLMSKLKDCRCDECGGEVVKRADDTIEIVNARYDDYIDMTYPIIKYYKNHKGYHKVDGQQSVEEVFDQICKILE